MKPLAAWMPLPLMLVIALAGCTARHRACAPPELTRASGLVPLTPTDDGSAVIETELLRSFVDQSRTSNAPGAEPVRKGKFLALSGGGMYGAYSVGVLSG